MHISSSHQPPSAKCVARIRSVVSGLHQGNWICEVESWDDKVEARIALKPKIPVEVEMEGIFGEHRVELGNAESNKSEKNAQIYFFAFFSRGGEGVQMHNLSGFRWII